MESDEARLVHLDQVDHQRRDEARHQGQDVREQRPGAIIRTPAGAVALLVVALRFGLLAVALLSVSLLTVALLTVSLLAVALLAPLAVALRAPLAVALRAVLAGALRAVLRVSGVVHGHVAFPSAAAVHPRNHRTEWRSPPASASARAAGIRRGTGWVRSGRWWPATPARSACPAPG